MSDQGRWPSIDPHKLRVYLDDHLAGSTAGVRRLHQVASTLDGTPAGALVAGVADQVAEEKDELVEIMDRLDARRSGVKQALAWAGELVARVKSDTPLTPRGSMNTLLEVELLRSAVIGKRGLWQTLETHAEELGLDRTRMGYLAERSERQIATLDEVHAFTRRRALRSRPSSAA